MPLTKIKETPDEITFMRNKNPQEIYTLEKGTNRILEWNIFDGEKTICDDGNIRNEINAIINEKTQTVTNCVQTIKRHERTKYTILFTRETKQLIQKLPTEKTNELFDSIRNQIEQQNSNIKDIHSNIVIEHIGPDNVIFNYEMSFDGKSFMDDLWNAHANVTCLADKINNVLQTFLRKEHSDG